MQFSLPSPDGKHWATIISSTRLWEMGWTHVAATYDGTTMALYINGVLQGTLVNSVAISLPKNAQIGVRQISANNYSNFLGYIEDLGVYNYAKSASEVTSDFGNAR